MKNRESLYPGRVKLTPVDAANGIYDMIRADEPQEVGTPLNKKLLDFAVAACGVTSGTATAYTLDDEFGGFELVDGAKVNFRLHVASGANPTLNVNGTGAKALMDSVGQPINEGVLADTWITARYNRAFDAFVIEGGGGNIVAGTYAGDGTGTIDFSLRLIGTKLSGASIVSTSPRNIILPFKANCVVIYPNGGTPSAPIYQGQKITAAMRCRVTVNNGSSNTSASVTTSGATFPLANFPIVSLDNNLLSLYANPTATPLQNSSDYKATYVSNLEFIDISDPAISSVAGANTAGKIYSYIAF